MKKKNRKMKKMEKKTEKMKRKVVGEEATEQGEGQQRQHP